MGELNNAWVDTCCLTIYLHGNCLFRDDFSLLALTDGGAMTSCLKQGLYTRRNGLINGHRNGGDNNNRKSREIWYGFIHILDYMGKLHIKTIICQFTGRV